MEQYRPNCKFLDRLLTGQKCTALSDDNTIIPLINESTKNRLTKEDLQILADALNSVLISFCEDWELIKYTVVPMTGEEVVNAFENPEASNQKIALLFIVIGDNNDLPGTAGYHTSNQLGNGKRIGVSYLFIESMIEENNGNIEAAKFMGISPFEISLSSVMCHELLEMISNRFVSNLNTTGGRPITLYTIEKAFGEFVNKDELFKDIDRIPILYVLNEVANPVQANKVFVFVRSRQVQVSDYVLRSWFDALDDTGPYSYLRTIKEPFSLDQGGYMHFYYNDIEYFNSRSRFETESSGSFI